MPATDQDLRSKRVVNKPPNQIAPQLTFSVELLRVARRIYATTKFLAQKFGDYSSGKSATRACQS